MDEKTVAQKDWEDDTKLNLKMEQDMSTERRGNIIRRLPKTFREKIYFAYQKKFGIPGREFQEMLEATKDEDEKGFKKQIGGTFDRRIAGEDDLPEIVARAVSQTVKWPATVQSMKGIVSAGPTRGWRYLQEKRAKGREK